MLSKEALHRSLLYGASSLVLSGLVYAGFVWQPEVDVWTLLSSADVQVRMAYGMPSHDQAGRVLAAREELIAAAERNLEAVERQAPGMAIALEFQGFVRGLRGDPAGAAALYRRASAAADATPEQRQVLVFNEARMLAQAGDTTAALAVFAAASGWLPPELQAERQVEEAELLRRAGRLSEAETTLDSIAGNAVVAPTAWIEAGLVYERLQRTEMAERCYQRASGGAPMGNYHLARLKLRGGDADNALELLERAWNVVPAEVRRQIGDDRDAWQALAESARFQKLIGSWPAAPGR